MKKNYIKELIVGKSFLGRMRIRFQKFLFAETGSGSCKCNTARISKKKLSMGVKKSNKK